nr:NADH dehydrogenase subunit 2 [Ficopomatus enigmaticus]
MVFFYPTCISILGLCSFMSFLSESVITLWLLMEVASFIYILSLYLGGGSRDCHNVVKLFLPMAYSGVVVIFFLIVSQVQPQEESSQLAVKLFLLGAMAFKFGVFPMNFWIGGFVKKTSDLEFFIFSSLFKIPGIIFFSKVLFSSEFIFFLAVLSLITVALGYTHKSVKSLLAYLSTNTTVWFVIICYYNKGLFLGFFLAYSGAIFFIFFSDSVFLKGTSLALLAGLPLGPYFFLKLSLISSVSFLSWLFYFFLLSGVGLSIGLYVKIFSALCVVPTEYYSKHFLVSTSKSWLLFFLVVLSSVLIVLMSVFFCFYSMKKFVKFSS